MAKDDPSKKPAKKSPKDTDQADLEAMEEAMEEDIVVVEDDADTEADEVQVVEEDVVVLADEPAKPATGKKLSTKATMLAKTDEPEEEPAPKRRDKKTKLAGGKPTTMLDMSEEEAEPTSQQSDKKSKPAAKETETEEEVLLVEEDESPSASGDEMRAVVAADDEMTELDIAVDQGASEVNLGEKWPKDRKKVLSGLDLDEDSKSSGRQKAATDDEAAALLSAEAKTAPGDDSSAVDLGSTPLQHMPPSGSREDGLNVEGESAVELTGSDSGIEVKEDSGVAIDVGDEAATAEADLEDKKPAKKPSRVLPWVGGTVVGTLLGAAACVALVFFDVVNLNDLLGKETKTSGGGGIKAPGTEISPARPALDFAGLKALGRHDEALKELEKAGDQDKKLVKERAEARLLAHLQKSKGVAKHTDEPVKKVTEEVKSAEPADALFLEGLALESTGERGLALAKYQDGLKQASDPRARRLFQAGIDRLESRSDDRPADNKPAEK